LLKSSTIHEDGGLTFALFFLPEVVEKSVILQVATQLWSKNTTKTLFD
jgi:hypothetical protein